MICWLWNTVPESSPMTLEKTWISRRREGHEDDIYYVLRRTPGHCWDFCLHCADLHTQSNLFSCDLQPRVHAVCHPLGPTVASGVTKKTGGTTSREMPSSLQFLELSVFSLCTFVLIKTTCLGDSVHDLNKLILKQSDYFHFTLWKLKNEPVETIPICRSLFHSSQLGGSNIDAICFL